MSLFSRLHKNAHLVISMRAAVVLLVLAPFGLIAWSQGVPASDDKIPSWRFQLPVAGSASVDTRTPTEIKAEDNYFDSCCGASDPLDGPQRMVGGTSGHAMFDEDLPARFRDEVFVAHFTTWAAHLSGSRHSIYTIVNLQIDRIVADKDGHITEGSVIPLIVPGGRVRTQGGQVLSHFIRGRDFPLEPNTKYLIFLNHQAGLPFYGYVKAWNVDKGVLEPTTAFDAYRIAHGRSSHAGKSLESAISELTSH